MHSGRRVFQIGFSRCGTTSLYRLFRESGVPSIHWDRGQIAINFAKRKEAGEDPFLDYPEIRFFSDMGNPMTGKLIEPYKDFRYIYRFYPDAYFILNTRTVQSWLLSRCNHARLVEWHQQALGISTLEELLLHWSLDWSQHMKDVKAFFADKPGQLLVFNIERDDPKNIVDFVYPEFALDARHYARSNEGRSQGKRFVSLPNYLVRR